MDAAEIVEAEHAAAAAVAVAAVDDVAEKLIQLLLMRHVDASLLAEVEEDSCSLLILHSRPFVSRDVFELIDNVSKNVSFLVIDFVFDNNWRGNRTFILNITSSIYSKSKF